MCGGTPRASPSAAPVLAALEAVAVLVLVGVREALAVLVILGVPVGCTFLRDLVVQAHFSEAVSEIILEVSAERVAAAPFIHSVAALLVVLVLALVAVS